MTQQNSRNVIASTDRTLIAHWKLKPGADTTKPIVNITALTPSQVFPGNTTSITASGTVADNVSVVSIERSLDGTPFVVVNDDPLGIASWSSTIGGLQSGSYIP